MNEAELIEWLADLVKRFCNTEDPQELARIKSEALSVLELFADSLAD